MIAKTDKIALGFYIPYVVFTFYGLTQYTQNDLFKIYVLMHISVILAWITMRCELKEFAEKHKLDDIFLNKYLFIMHILGYEFMISSNPDSLLYKIYYLYFTLCLIFTVFIIPAVGITITMYAYINSN